MLHLLSLIIGILLFLFLTDQISAGNIPDRYTTPYKLVSLGHLWDCPHSSLKIHPLPATPPIYHRFWSTLVLDLIFLIFPPPFKMGSLGQDTHEQRRPRVAITLGDPAGIGPELVAKLLSSSNNAAALLARADVFLLASRQEVGAAEAAAGGVKIPLALAASATPTPAAPPGAAAGSSSAPAPGTKLVLRIPDDDEDEDDGGDDRDNSNPSTAQDHVKIYLAQVSREAGQRALDQLRRAVDLAKAGRVDAIVFAPLNKSSLKLAGMREEDELRWFAKQLGCDEGATTSEINIAGDLWTARVTSHVGIEKVAGMVTRESTLKAIELLHRLR